MIACDNEFVEKNLIKNYNFSINKNSAKLNGSTFLVLA